MKEFYVMNLDMRRIAIMAGGALTVLGLALFIGMAIGRGQGEKAARVSVEESQQQKLGLPAAESADKLVLSSGPTPVEKFSAIEKVAPVIPSVPEIKSEIPLREDPLVAGPPTSKKRASTKKSHRVAKSDRDDAESSEKPRKRKAIAKAKRSEREEPEVSGRVEHTKNKRKKRSSGDSDDELAAVAGTSSAQRAAASRYTIQVAAFKRSSEANGLIDKLKGEGIKAHSEKNGDFYLVTVGRTKSKLKLEKALSRLKELEYQAYIRKLSTRTDET